MLVAEGKFLSLRLAPRGITLAEFELFSLDLDFTWSWPGAVASAEDDVIAVDFAHFRCSRARLLPTANRYICLISLHLSRAAAFPLGASYSDIFALHIPHARGRWGRSTTADDKRVLLDVATATSASAGRRLLFPRSHDQGTRSGSAVVLTQEVRSAPAGIAAAREFDVELVVAAVAAVAIAIEVALPLLVELGSGIAARHGVDDCDEKAVSCSAGWAGTGGTAGWQWDCTVWMAGGVWEEEGSRPEEAGEEAGLLRRMRERRRMDLGPGCASVKGRGGREERGELALVVGC
jgi:hypothetical protein